MMGIKWMMWKLTSKYMRDRNCPSTQKKFYLQICNLNDPLNFRRLLGKEDKLKLDKAFPNVAELPEPELYFGGDKGETETEHDLRMIRVSQKEEMQRL